jgi:O-antigen ligase
MSVALRPARALRPLAGLLGRLGAALFVVAAGITLGLQYVTPHRRVIAVLAAILVFGITWRLDMVSGLGVLAIALPFPRGTVFGNTNLAFILLLLVLWLLRATQGQSPLPRRSPLDAPVLALFLIYVVSFYNVESAGNLARALENFELIAASMLMFFLILNNLNTERDLRRFLNFQAVAVLLVCLLAVYELNHPGQSFIRGWIGFQHTTGTDFDTRNIRVGSSFFDFELLSEFCALSALMVLFLMARARSVGQRVAFGALLVLVVFVLFATVTRGAMIALGLGTLYFLWLVRRRLNFVTLVTLTVFLVIVALSMNYYVANFTRSGDVMARLSESQLVGFIPDSRVEAWTGAWERIFEHPLIGHGPYYSMISGTRIWFWPHCLYLYVANSVGFIGLAIFLWLLWTLLRISKPDTDDLLRGGFAQSYLIIAHVQMVVFVVNQIKIEFLRNSIYQFQVWLLFAVIVAAHRIARQARAPEAAPAPARSFPRR